MQKRPLQGESGMRSASLLGRDHHHLGHLATVAEGHAAITLSRGGASKTYSYTEPNEDVAFFALGDGGSLIAVADGHFGASGSEALLDFLSSSRAPEWTAPGPLGHDTRSWQAHSLQTLHACGRAILNRAAELGLPPAPSTLSIALIRPEEDQVAWVSAGDSHVFLVDEKGATDVGWQSLGRRKAYYLGYEAATPEGMEGTFLAGISPLEGLSAVVLATDGISEPGIGFPDPAESVQIAMTESRETPSETRPIKLAKNLSEAALAIQRTHKAGDNVACAVIDLRKA